MAAGREGRSYRVARALFARVRGTRPEGRAPFALSFGSTFGVREPAEHVELAIDDLRGRLPRIFFPMAAQRAPITSG